MSEARAIEACRREAYVRAKQDTVMTSCIAVRGDDRAVGGCDDQGFASWDLPEVTSELRIDGICKLTGDVGNTNYLSLTLSYP